MLIGKGNPDDGDKKEDTEEQVGETDPYAAYQNPDNIEDDVEASVGTVMGDDFFAERPEAQSREFERLNAKGYAYDGDHHQDA